MTTRALRDLQDDLVGSEDVREFDVDEISPGNYRETGEEGLDDLMASIDQVGQLQPGGVVKKGDLWEILFGLRRYLALRRLGKRKFRARVYPESLSKLDRLRIPLIENKHRLEDDPFDAATQVQAIKAEVSGSNKEVARLLGLKEPFICKLLKRLELFDEELMELVRSGKLSRRAADAISRVKDKALRKALMERAVEGGLTAEQVEQLCREAKAPKIAARKIVVQLASGLVVTILVPTTLAVPDFVSGVDDIAKEARKCATQRPEMREFLIQLSLNLPGRRS